MQGLKTGACVWAIPTKANSRPNVTASTLQKELLENYIFWLFDHFIVDLLKVKLRQYATQ